MNKDFDNAYQGINTDSVIARGFEIYDGWIDKKFSSRQIVASVQNEVKLLRKNKKNIDTFISALAYLFALDIRIKERYNTILRCLFSFFSWRRETRALEMLKSVLNIPLGSADIRDAIAIELERLGEKLENEWDEDGDDDTRGGKRNGKPGDEDAAEEKQAEETAEENPDEEELSEEETKEDSEREEEKSADEKSQDAKEEVGKENASDEAQQEQTEENALDKEELAQDEKEALNEENDGTKENEEPSTDKKKQERSQDGAIDIPVIIEESESVKADKISFLDEIILDKIARGMNISDAIRMENIVDPTQDDPKIEDNAPKNDNGDKASEKDSHLDERFGEMNGNEATHEAENTPDQASEQKTEQTTAKTEEKPTAQTTEQPTEQKTDNTNLTDQNKEDRVPVKVDIDADQLNAVASQLNESMSLESKMDYIEMQMDMMREQIRIASEEVGIDAPVPTMSIKNSDPPVINQPTVAPNIKK